ncbi:hypothetical protein RHECNPAF_2190035 [Rhizobium etli CNPAF512]|nr:hypothetical protein RHECNPAF_2190035 [Rhizobium etli CNPAF512]
MRFGHEPDQGRDDEDRNNGKRKRSRTFQHCGPALSCRAIASSGRRLDHVGPPASATKINLALGICLQHKSGASQHGFDRCLVRDEPVGRIGRIALFDEEQRRVVPPVENVPFRKFIVILKRGNPLLAPLQTLEQHEIANHVFVEQIKCQQRMAQVVKDTHEEHEIEGFAELCNLINRHLPELDVEGKMIGGETGLFEIAWITIDAENPARVAAFHLEGIKSGIAADIKNAAACKIVRHHMFETVPFECRVVAEKMVRRGLDLPQPHIMEPGAQFFDTPFQRRVHHRASAFRSVLQGGCLRGRHSATRARRSCSLAWAIVQIGGKPVDCISQPFGKRYRRLPIEKLHRAGNIRPATLGIVLRQRLVGEHGPNRHH